MANETLHPIVICLNNGHCASFVITQQQLHICKRRIEWRQFLFIRIFFDALFFLLVILRWVLISPFVLLSMVSKTHLPFVLTNNQLKSIFQTRFLNLNRVMKSASPRNVTQFTQIMTINFFLLFCCHYSLNPKPTIIQNWMDITQIFTTDHNLNYENCGLKLMSFLSNSLI